MEALLAVVEGGGSAAAKASASRTLLEWFGDIDGEGPQRPVAEWTCAELDAEIERCSRLTRLTAVRE